MNLLRKVFAPTHIVALQKITQAITGFGTLLMVAHFMTPEEQGYFYTMGSLLSSYIIFDLGLSSYILQRSAQLSNGLTIDQRGDISPEGEQRNHFLSFVYWTFKWYRNVGIIGLLILIPVGLWVLGHNTNAPLENSYLPWVVIAFAVAINMPTIGIFAALEGTGAIRETYLLRIAHYSIGALVSWALIAAHNGLYAQAIPLVTTSIICYGWIFYRYRNSLKARVNDKKQHIQREALQQIKHTASIWLANYIFLNIPVIGNFISGDSVSAGKLGLSIAIANVAGAVAMSASTAKLPGLIKQIKSCQLLEASATFSKTMWQFLSIYSFGAATLVLLMLNLTEFDLFKRLLAPLDLILLFVAFSGFHITNVLVIFLRAQGRNNLSFPILLIACLITPIAFLFSSLGVTGTILSMCVFSMSACYIAFKARAS